MASASAIQPTWLAMSRTWAHTCRGGTPIVVLTSMRATGSAAQLCGRHLGCDDVDEDTGAELEAGPRRELGQHVGVPVEDPLVAVRRGVEHDVVGHVAEAVPEAAQGG